MTQMKSGLGYWISAALAVLAALGAEDTSWAAQPQPWQMGLQPAATAHMEFINWFHNFLLIIITAVAVFVLLLLLYVMVRYNTRANPTPSKVTHSTLLEVAWTLVPILILIVIAVPSFRLLYEGDVIPKADITVKVTGLPSWAWTYNYPDHGLEFTAQMLTDADAAAKGEPRLLATDYKMVVPVGKVVRMQVTSSPEGIIHAWAVPAFGVKIDAVPGRLNETWFRADREGVYYGQCSELCGLKHAYMPIAVEVVSEAKFAEWVEKSKAEFGTSALIGPHLAKAQ